MKYSKFTHGAAVAAFALLLAAPSTEASPEPGPAPAVHRAPAAAMGAAAAAAAQDRGRTAKPRSGQSSSSSASSRTGSRSPRRAEPRSSGRASGTRHPGADRDRHRRSHGGGGHHTIYWGGPYWPYGVWVGGWPWYPWGWYGYGGYYGHVAYYQSRVRESMGALDLDLRPEEAAVYLNGQPIGIADNFDGWPRYLWLDEGTYDLVFHREGYETLARTFTIYPGVVIDVTDRMVPGDARPAEELIAEAAARRQAEDGDARRQARSDRSDERAADWRDRVRRERGRPPADADEGTPAPAEDRGVYDARSEPLRLVLDVEPRDATVYLDGRFLGSAEELSRGGAAVLVDPGEHRVEILRPGYATHSETVEGEAGEEVALEIELTPEE